MSSPNCYYGPSFYLGALFNYFNLKMKYTTKSGGRHVQLMLSSEQVLAQWWHLVAFRNTMSLLHWVIHMVFYWRTVMTIKTASKVGTFLIDVLFAVTLAAAGAIWSKKLPDGGVQWLPV